MLAAVQANQYDAVIKLMDEMNVKDGKLKGLEDEIKTLKTVYY